MKRLMNKKLPVLVTCWSVIIGLMLITSPAYSRDWRDYNSRQKTTHPRVVERVRIVHHDNFFPAIIATGLIAGLTFSMIANNNAPAPQPVAPPCNTGVASQAVVTSSVVVTAGLLNVRSGPALDAPALGQIYNGTVLTVTGSAGGWYQVRTPDGLAGWVMTQFTSPVASPAAG